LRNHLDVSPPSSAVVLSALFNIAVGRKRGGRVPESNLTDAFVHEVCLLVHGPELS
jgi:hypothetical protein